MTEDKIIRYKEVAKEEDFFLSCSLPTRRRKSLCLSEEEHSLLLHRDYKERNLSPGCSKVRQRVASNEAEAPKRNKLLHQVFSLSWKTNTTTTFLCEYVRDTIGVQYNNIQRQSNNMKMMMINK